MLMLFECYKMAQNMTLHPCTRVLVRLHEFVPLRRMSRFFPSDRLYGSLRVSLYKAVYLTIHRPKAFTIREKRQQD